MKSRFSAFAVMSIAFLSAFTAQAATVQVKDVQFTKVIDIKDQRLHLKGAALLKYMIFIDAYAGALYLPAAQPAVEALDPVPKRLELSYFHAIDGEDFAEATRVKIRDNVSADEAQQLKPRIDQLAAMYRDVQPGDRYALTYVPGDGTRLSLNGNDLGAIPGDDFARAVFSIWLGTNPIDEKFRDRLLGDA
jgi:hypothetical protein